MGAMGALRRRADVSRINVAMLCVYAILFTCKAKACEHACVFPQSHVQTHSNMVGNVKCSSWEGFRPFVALTLAVTIVAILACIVATCLVCANPYEPRLHGKAAVLRQLSSAAAGKAHALPFAWADTIDGAVAQARQLAYPVVVKPNALTSCALGVHLVRTEHELRRRLGQLLPLLHQGQWRGVVLQQYYGGAGCIEARVYGVRRRDGSWAWDPVVYAVAPAEHAIVHQTQMSAALRNEIGTMMAAAFPDMTVVAMDVRAPSLDALQQDANFAVLEVNGTFGVAHTWRGHDNFLVSVGHMGLDLARWFFPRVAWGARNACSGRVPVAQRLAQEWQWVWAANATLKRVRTKFEPDAADLI